MPNNSWLFTNSKKSSQAKSGKPFYLKAIRLLTQLK